MRLTSGLVDGREELWWITGDGPLRVALVAGLRGEVETNWTMMKVLCEGQRAMDQLQAWLSWALERGLKTDRIPQQTLAPVPRPGKILCVGLNYRPHVRESRMELPVEPVLFSKYANTVVGPDTRVHPPADAKQVDYEAELVMIMGRRCARVPVEQALSCVAGYCNGNDLSARDLQFRSSQWLLGKTPDGFAPMGPYLVTAEEVPDPNQLEIVGRRNGVEVQHANTRDMIFSCPDLISYLSRYITLDPGDVIFTGTPEGVILGQSEGQRHWLRAGETVSVAVEGLGELTTVIGDFGQETTSAAEIASRR